MVELSDFVVLIVILSIILFSVIVYLIYYDVKDTIAKKPDKKCPKKCVKPKKVTGSCYHPVKYNSYLKKNQEVRSELICPWSCSSGFSDDPYTCQYDVDCSGCSPDVSFKNIDSKCPKFTYGCCGDGKTERTDEFGNNCLALLY